ncbi:cyclin-O [Corythoichthys intestinalis]|uniref:cyclin-O n=1 Tax=Corythoichthys intestinalis TaxID=161448 RepID=UPI0025A54E48|nr:cyclin-O [Corythoichthys intestinalis]XP_061803875.1 cyclin-O-like [Nerophis lumbriciformis]
MMLMERVGDGSVRVRVKRYRKQKLVSRLSDSGFEEDFAASPTPLLVDDSAAEVSCWYLQYGDVGYRIQREREALFYPCKSLALQPQVTADARCQLVSWLIPVHKHFRLSFECCCLTVNIMDRFLACMPVAADCFQLLGLTALLLASKKVEVFSPSISQLLSLCCAAFTREQLCNLECLILLRLDFRLDAPTLAFFLDYHASRTEASRHRVDLARKVCELSLADYAFDKYAPSLTAECALSLAGELLRESRDDVENLRGNALARECRNNLKLLAALNSLTAIDGERRHWE